MPGKTLIADMEVEDQTSTWSTLSPYSLPQLPSIPLHIISPSRICVNQQQWTRFRLLVRRSLHLLALNRRIQLSKTLLRCNFLHRTLLVL
jgi:hypothetical protein